MGAFSHYTHTDDPAAETARLRAYLEKSGYAEQIQRVERALTTKDVWAAQPGAAPEDVLSTWHQLVALHHKAYALFRELKDAELALSQDATDSNFTWLKDVSARLESLDGTEALIEGFGDSSGRSKQGV
jgi:DNA primase